MQCHHGDYCQGTGPDCAPGAPTDAEREAWLKRPGPITGDEVLRFAPAEWPFGLPRRAPGATLRDQGAEP